MTKREMLLTTALVSGVLHGGTAFGADFYLEGTPNAPTVIPAVSGLNGKIGILGGALDDDGFGALEASISAPLGMRYGLQGDAIIGITDGDFVGGGGAHLFWRDPILGLLGVYGGYTRSEDVDSSVGRIGIEGEFYHQQLTLKTVLGAEFVNADARFIEPDDGFFAFTDVSYYLNDNLEVSIGHRYSFETNELALGAEYQLDQQIFSSGVALFAEGRIGDDDRYAAWGGVRLYLGDNKSLIRRHREDDPDGQGDEDLFDLGVKLVGKDIPSGP